MDAKLAVLLVAGATDPRIISRHKRLQAIGLGTFVSWWPNSETLR